jgi:hypothetical protein
MGWKRIRADLGDAKGSYTKIGIQEGEKRDDAAPMVVIAVAHEFGTENGAPPERSWLRSTYEAKRKDLEGMLQRAASAIIRGRVKPRQAMAVIGAQHQKDVQAAIRAGIDPPLSPVTLERRRNQDKASAVPLIDSAQFIQSIRHVEGQGKESGR